VLTFSLIHILLKQGKFTAENPLLIMTVTGLLVSGFLLFFLSLKPPRHANSEKATASHPGDIDSKEEILVENDNIKPEEKKTNYQILDKLSILNNEKKINEATGKILSILANEYNFVQGIAFVYEKNAGEFTFSSEYAYYNEQKPSNFKTGETLLGQAAKNNKILYISDIPEKFVKIISGLGESYPNYILIIPVSLENRVIAVFEFAGFKKLEEDDTRVLEEVAHQSALIINKLKL